MAWLSLHADSSERQLSRGRVGAGVASSPPTDPDAHVFDAGKPPVRFDEPDVETESRTNHGGVALEMVAAEVLIHRAVFEHVVDGGQDRGDDSHDRLLGAAPRFEAIELSLQIAAFRSRCR
jgi:hypothetical protein